MLIDSFEYFLPEDIGEDFEVQILLPHEDVMTVHLFDMKEIDYFLRYQDVRRVADRYFPNSYGIVRVYKGDLFGIVAHHTFVREHTDPPKVVVVKKCKVPIPEYRNFSIVMGDGCWECKVCGDMLSFSFSNSDEKYLKLETRRIELSHYRQKHPELLKK